jgi:small subunit ribosomal protein S1
MERPPTENEESASEEVTESGVKNPLAEAVTPDAAAPESTEGDPSRAVTMPEISPRALLHEAQEKALPVEGKVVAQRGSLGLDVDLGGGILALCPMAEVDVRHKENPGKLVGETLKFLVKEITEKEILLSRRALLEVESYARVIEARKRAVPGAVLKGRVTSIREFGVFVDIGGIEGLVHVSELSHERVTNPKGVVKVGEEIEVQVLKVEHEPGKSDRISLSRKAREPSAFDKTADSLVEGQKLKGKVSRLSTFGAFVEIAPGVQGLVHLSALSPTHVAKPDDVVKEGEEIDVEVLGVDKEKHRISLKRIPTEPELAAAAEQKEAKKVQNRERRQKAKEAKERAKLKPHERLKPGEIVDVTVDRLEPYGLFVKIGGGGRGMIHVSEMGTPKGTDHAKEFPSGTKFKAAVLEISVDPTPKIRLSKAAVEKIEAGATVETYLAEKALLAAAEKPKREPRSAPPRRGPRDPKSASGPRANGDRPPRSSESRDSRPRRPREGSTPGALSKPKPGGLGTLGDLFKAKLAAKKP